MDRGEPQVSRLRGLDGDRAVILACAVVAVLLGVLGLLGWSQEGPFAREPFVSLLTVNPATAVALIAGGCSIALAGAERRGLAIGAALLMAGIAAAKFADLLFDVVPIDRLLFTQHLDSEPLLHVSRMAPNTAAALATAGLALMLLHSRRRYAKVVAQLFAIWIMLIAGFVLVGHFFDLLSFSRIGSYVPMARVTALGILAIGLGILGLSRDVGLVLILGDRGPAGTMCRITLPILVAFPLAVGVLRIWGEQQGYYGAQAGLAIQIMTNVVITTTLLMVSALALHRSDLARRDRERALRNSEQLNRLVASVNPDRIALLDEDYTLLFANDALLRAHGTTDASKLIGTSYTYWLDAAARAECEAALEDARIRGEGQLTLRYTDPGGGDPRWFETVISRLPGDQDRSFRFLAISRDISEKREIEDQVRWKETHDDLTRLPNRAKFQESLDRHVHRVGQEGFALLVIDIDNFKAVNDTLGHDAGDRLLKTVADRIAGAVREGDVVARLAADEFAVIARNIRTEPGAIAIAERVFESLREPWLYQGRLGECRVSIGASLAPRHGDSVERLFKHADIALDEAKARGKGQVAVFRPSMKSAVEKRSRQISLARHALASDFIIPYYQPKIALGAGRVAGFEALLRWRHPTQGVQMPGSIQAAFEDMELASEITQRMLDHVLIDMRRWLDRGMNFGHVAINVTAADLRQNDFADRLLGSLRRHDLPPECLQVEITETVFMGRGAEYVERALRLLHDAGIRIALDDFGTGYASLSHLKQFPVDIVKIDRSFLHDFALDPQNQAIINTVISLGHSLDIEIVAEGIETREQERHLLARGCTYGQGYLYGKAVPAQRVPRLLKTAPRELRKAA
jgi:diguanylate cyclase (GGDEF)-like protein/PAS domain S-box-containing protein